MAAALAAGALACAATPAAARAQADGSYETRQSQIAIGAGGEAPTVTIAVIPRETGPQDLAGIPGMSVGVMSAGLATVTATQTFLDIGAGNRVFTSLYDGEKPLVLRVGSDLRGSEDITASVVPGWDAIVERAESVPAEIVPGLLASTIQDGSIPIFADARLRTPALIAANRDGEVVRIQAGACLTARCPGVTVVPATLPRLRALATRLRDDDTLIAIERPPPPEHDTLTIGIAGRGFGDGNLTSDTTRTDGFVLATDLAPTILDRYGIDPPDEMSGRPIRAEGELDAAGVADRAERMTKVAGRRLEVILMNLILWTGLALLAALLFRGRAAKVAFALLGLSVVYLPVLLLVGAAVMPTEMEERLIVGLGAPALAALTLLLRRGWGALAIACGITVGAYAIDAIAGSSLIARSLLGPNPGLGVRFFGIGNELESTLAVLIPVGTGAALAAFAARSAKPPSPRAALIAFLATGGVAAAVFAAGRFGADVGAAIVFPAGAVAAALAVPGAIRGRRPLLVLIAAPVIGLAILALVDLVLGGDAHLSRSVFEAGGADQLADVFERRLRLSASSFNRATGQILFWFAVLVVVCVIVFRRRIMALLAKTPLVRAGFAGAAAAVLLGVVANDSGATFLIIGTIVGLGCLAFVYAQTRASGDPAG